jgi:hypothetical protein
MTSLGSFILKFADTFSNGSCKSSCCCVDIEHEEDPHIGNNIITP